MSIFSRDILFTGIRVVTTIMIARILGPTGVGIWAVLELITNYSRVFGGPRLEIASVHFLGKKVYDRGEILFITNAAAVFFSLLVAGLWLWKLDWLMALFFRNENIPAVLVAAVVLHVPLVFLKRNYMYFLLAREDITSYNRLFFYQDLTKCVVTIVLLFVYHLGIWGLAGGLIAGSLTSTLYGMARVHRYESMRYRVRWPLIRHMIRFSSGVYFSEATGFLNTYIANLLTALFLPPSALAFFSMAKGKAEWLYRVTNATSTVLYPRVANQSADAAASARITTRTYRISFLAMVVMACGFAVAIYPATVLLYGPAFVSLVVPFWLMLPGVVLFGAVGNLRQYFLGLGRSDIPMKISAVPLVLQTGLCYLLIPRWGLLGAALSVLVPFVLTAVITIIVYHIYSRESYRAILIPTTEDVVWLWRMGLTQLREAWAKIAPAVRWRRLAENRS